MLSRAAFAMIAQFATARHRMRADVEWALLMCRYAETVIYRIFYALDRSNIGRLTLRDLRRQG